MGKEDGIARGSIEWDPFAEDPVALVDILQAEAGMSMPSARTASMLRDQRKGYGRVHVVRPSLRMARLLVHWGWQMTPSEQQTEDTVRSLFCDDPVGASPEHPLIVRRKAAKAVLKSIGDMFGEEEGRFFDRPVEVIRARGGGATFRFEARPDVDLLEVDLHEGMSRAAIVDLLTVEAEQEVRLWGRIAPAGLVLAEVERRIDQLNRAREILGSGLPMLDAPGISSIRRRLAR